MCQSKTDGGRETTRQGYQNLSFPTNTFQYGTSWLKLRILKEIEAWQENNCKYSWSSSCLIVISIA